MYLADGDLAVTIDGASGLGVSLGQFGQEFLVGQQDGFVQEISDSLTEEIHVGVLKIKIKIIYFILIKFKFLSYGNGLLQASEDIAISDLEGLDPREEFVETFVDVGGELVKAVLKFVAFGLVEICNRK